MALRKVLLQHYKSLKPERRIEIVFSFNHDIVSHAPIAVALVSVISWSLSLSPIQI